MGKVSSPFNHYLRYVVIVVSSKITNELEEDCIAKHRHLVRLDEQNSTTLAHQGQRMTVWLIVQESWFASAYLRPRPRSFIHAQSMVEIKLKTKLKDLFWSKSQFEPNGLWPRFGKLSEINIFVALRLVTYVHFTCARQVLHQAGKWNKKLSTTRQAERGTWLKYWIDWNNDFRLMLRFYERANM